jgi:hypothetical protein
MKLDNHGIPIAPFWERLRVMWHVFMGRPIGFRLRIIPTVHGLCIRPAPGTDVHLSSCHVGPTPESRFQAMNKAQVEEEKRRFLSS